MNYIDRTGLTYGDYTVIKRMENRSYENGNVVARWLVKCNLCGCEKIVGSCSVPRMGKCRCRVGRKPRGNYDEVPLCRYNDGVGCEVTRQEKCYECGWYRQYLKQNKGQ